MKEAALSKRYGYVRVSTREQKEDRQTIALLKAGIEPHCIFMDKQSGKDFNRPEYKRLLRRLRAGDVLTIKSVDRLGRNYTEILEQWRIITKQKHVNIVVLDTPILNASAQHDLMGTVIADIILQLESCFAETEREYIRQRQAEGIAAAKARGVRFGRSPLVQPQEFAVVFSDWIDGKISARKAAGLLKVSHQTFLKWVRL